MIPHPWGYPGILLVTIAILDGLHIYYRDRQMNKRAF